MSDPLSMSDVLGVKYLGKWEWSPDGKHIAFIWDDGGLRDLYIVEPGISGPRRLTAAKAAVSDFVWTGTGDIIAVVDSALVQLAAESGFTEQSTLLKGRQIGGLSLSGDGGFLAFNKAGAIWVRDQSSGSLTELTIPGRPQQLDHGGGPVAWSPSSRRFAFAFRDDESYSQIGVARVTEMGSSVDWRSHFERTAGGLSWLDDETLVFTRPRPSGMSAEVVTMKIPAHGSLPVLETILQVEGTEKGPIMFASGTPSPDRTMILLMLENDGWAHHYIFDLATRELRQTTFGQCEDFAHAGDSAVWLRDSSGFLFASNRNAPDQRQIFRYDKKTDACAEVIGLSGTNSMVSISPDGRLAFQHCDEYRNMDLWVSGPNGEETRQVTFSMPSTWTPESQYAPEEVIYESAGGLSVHGYLMKPKVIETGTRLPAVVWVHGGPVRQMRKGWNPMRSYALFHAYNQYLVGQGYVVLSVNFRGGIGYGRDFRQALYHKMGVDDVADVVGAGNYLKSLPFVDSERVAVYGLSYGGYMTLHCLTQYPDVFRCGINIAGIWDYVQWTKWADKRYGRRVGSFKIYLGGEPEESPGLYRIGSPKTYVAGIQAPLLNVHGTADMNVDFQQMDSIIQDLVEHGKDFEVAYYPNEVHTFAKRKTWMDAMPKMTAYFDQHLK